MKPRALALDSTLFDSPYGNSRTLDHSYVSVSRSLYVPRSQPVLEEYVRDSYRPSASVITLDFVEGLVASLRRIEPNYILPKIGNDEQSLQLFVAQLCASLLHWLAQIKGNKRNEIDAELEGKRRNLVSREQELAEVAQRLIDERKDIEMEKQEMRRERTEMEQLRMESLRDREALHRHMKEVERQAVELEKDIEERRKDEQSEENRRSLLSTKFQQMLRQQQLLQKQIDDLTKAKTDKELLLSELEDQIQDRENALAQYSAQISQNEAKVQSCEKEQYMDSLQTQLELDKTRHRIQSDQSQLEQQRADFLTEELKFNDAFTQRICRLGKLGEELEQRNQDLSRAKERFDMCRCDLESQVELLKGKLAETRRHNADLIFKISELTDELHSLKLQEKLCVVSVSQTQADLSFREQMLMERETELEAKLEAAKVREDTYKAKLKELSGVEEALKAAQEALTVMKKENSATEAVFNQQKAKFKADLMNFEQEKANFELTRKKIEDESSKLQGNKADLDRIMSTSQSLSQELQANREKLKTEEENLQRDKDKVKELVSLLESEGLKLGQKEEQIRAFARQLNAREQQLYEREKSLRRKEYRLQEHKSEREALKFRTPNEEHDLFDPDEMLSCTLSPSPGEPHSLERSPYQ